MSFVELYDDITERKRSEATLRESEQRFHALFAASPVPFMVLAPDAPYFTITAANDAYLAATLTVREHLVGSKLFDIFTDDPTRTEPDGPDKLRASLARVMATRLPDAMERTRHDIRKPDGTFEPRWWLAINAPVLDASGQVNTIIHQVTNVTGLHLAEVSGRENQERQAFLLRLSDALRPLSDPIATQDIAARMLGIQLNVDRCYYAEFDWPANSLSICREYTRTAAVSAIGTHPINAFDDMLKHSHKGEPIVCDNIATHPIFSTEMAAYRERGTDAFILIPLVKQGVMVACVCVTMETPRPWSPAEVETVREMAGRTWAAVEQSKAEAALRESERRLSRELESTRRLQEISSLLNQREPGDALFGSILDAAMFIMRAQFASMQMRIGDSTNLHLLASRNLHPDSAEFWQTVAHSSGSICGSALKEEERIIVPDVRTVDWINNSESMEHYRKCGIIAVQSTPLRSSKGRVMGMLSTHWDEPHVPDENELRLLDLLVRQVADFFERRVAQKALRESEAWLAGQKDALQAAVADVPLSESLGILARAAAQRMGTGVRCGFYAVSSEGTDVHHIAGMPDSYAEYVNGFKVGTDSLACGLAVATPTPIITPDVRTDPLWNEWLWLAEKYDFRAVWSYPIETVSGTIVGTMAFYFPTPRDATTYDHEAASLATRAAAIILSRSREIEDREHAEAAVLESEERFRLFVENVREYALVQTDLEGVITSWNPGAERLFNFTSAEIVGHPFITLLPTDDRHDGIIAREMARLSEGKKNEDQHFFRRKDGSQFWCEWITEPVFDDTGKIRGTAKVMRDETERQEADDALRATVREKEALLAEVHHRVKNNLQVITSLLSLQSRSLEHEKALVLFNETLNRVQSISSIHELIYRSTSFAELDLATYARRLVPDLILFYGAQTRVQPVIEGENVTLELERAVPFGLLLNEIIANALKHGYPGDTAGSLHVALRDDDEAIHLLVRDGGKGLPADFEPGDQTSLGLRLVHILVRQLGGTIEFSTQAGTQVEVHIPIQNGIKNERARASKA